MKKHIATLRAAELRRVNNVGHADSVEKIVGQLAMLSPGPVSYFPTRPDGSLGRERVFRGSASRIVVGPSVFREFVCASGCTACCQKFTLDYTPEEFLNVQHRAGFVERIVVVNGKRRVIITNDQNANPICDFLSVEKPSGGLGCAQWPTPPLSCHSAPQVQLQQRPDGSTHVLKRPFGRAWAMRPTPKCEFEATTDFSRMDLDGIIAIFDRFRRWGEYLGVPTRAVDVQRAIRDQEARGVVPTASIVAWEKA